MPTEEMISEGRQASRLDRLGRLLANRMPWGNLPVRMRAFYIAQRKRCGICGEALVIDRRGGDQATWDHVIPRSERGGGFDRKNKILAHRQCNTIKGNRPPTGCELLFCTVTNEIVFSTTREL